MKTKQCLLLLATTFIVACGGDGSSTGDSSGISSTKRVDELSAAEITQLCQWAIDQYPNSVTCDGITMEVNDALRALALATCQEQAEANAGTCDVTVGQAEACFEAQLAELCNDDDPSECAALNACSE